MTRVQRSVLTTLIFLAAGGAAAFFAWKDRSTRPDELQKEADAARLFRFAPANAQKISLDAKGQRIEMERKPGAWMITFPIVWRPSRARCARAASSSE